MLYQLYVSLLYHVRPGTGRRGAPEAAGAGGPGLSAARAAGSAGTGDTTSFELNIFVQKYSRFLISNKNNSNVYRRPLGTTY